MIEGNTTTDVLGGLNATSTFIGPKPWAECSPEEKCDRLREQVEAWRNECDRLRSRLAVLEGHRHGGNGEILVLLDQVDRLQMHRAASSFNTLR